MSLFVPKTSQKPLTCVRHIRRISIFQVDFLKISNISRTQNENFDKFFDPKEPEYNTFGPILEHSKITVFLFIQSSQYY